MLPPFKSWRSTVTASMVKTMGVVRGLFHPDTGALVGFQTQGGQGPDARIAPVDITAAEMASPPALMLADLDATFRLNESPYTRLYSDGTSLTPIGGVAGNTYPAGMQTIPPGTPPLTLASGFFQTIYAPLTVQNLGGLTVEGTLLVINQP